MIKEPKVCVKDVPRVRKAIRSTIKLLREKGEQVWWFHHSRVPSCRTKGCVVGWIGYFLGVPEGTYITHVIPGIPYYHFSNLMDSIDEGWYESPRDAARVLKKFMDKHVPLPRKRAARA